jgi:phage terminase Nu1 subunit (DNA packaging protein)
MWESTTALRAVLVEAKPDGLDPQQERARKDAAQALKTEMENLRRAGQLMEASEVTAAWADHISSARSRLLAIPSKLPPLMEGRPAAAMQALLRTEINAALHELAGA